ncbi:hypothetical protein [Herbiconiux daphne]|uniref:Uncharacterized protein n=2 Tax=Actinomycetes TaxID=1760 RepID=A0ABT2H8Z8_9MICO|nr:hypothetical protein [Herbiconiux daphne]MCS5736374.1 hypothetical protein [Herbiconiux daphne]
MALYGVEVDTTKYYYTMNPWDDHPLIVYAESVFPEEDFLNYVKQDLFNNHTMVMVDQKLSRAIERTTKFANPVARIIDKTCYDLDIHTLADLEKKFDQIDIEHEIYKKLGIIKKHFENHLRKNNGTIYARAMNAMNSNNSFELAAILGLKFDGDGGNAKTYNTEKLETADTYALLKKSTEVSDLFMGWDIDHRRRLVLTPTVLAKRQLPSGKIIMNILTLPQVVIPTSGVGDAGERIDALSDQMIVAMESVMRAYKESTSHIRNFVGKIKVSIDDNFRHYISILNKKTMSIATDYVFFLAQKHGSWDIMHRQT